MNQALRIALHRIIGSFVTGLFQNIQERMKALVFVFIFVLVDEQAITPDQQGTVHPSASFPKESEP